MDLIILQTFQLAHKACLLKSILENEGIESYIYDEHIVAAQPMYANTVGGIKLKIQKKDFERAFQVLEGTEYEIIFQKEEEQSQNFAKHIISIIFSKETIIAVIVLLFILYLFYSNFISNTDSY
jgi:hypothetical protein